MRTAVIIPTYNEAENIERLLVAVRIAAPSIDIIVRESMLLVTRWGIALRTGIGQKHLQR